MAISWLRRSRAFFPESESSFVTVNEADQL